MSKLIPRLRSIVLLGALSAAALIVSAGAGAQAPAALHARQKTELFNGSVVAAGQVIVKFANWAAPEAVEHAKAAAGAELDVAVGARGARLLRSRSKNVETLVRELSARHDVVYAEPNYVVRVNSVPNDPSFGDQWALRNTGYTPAAGAGTAGADISAVSAWEVSTGSRDTVVAVVGTGVDSHHPDLTANMWSAPAPFTVQIGGQTIRCEAGTRGFDALTNTCAPADEYNHGTHVAGIIGAVGDNGTGVAGVNRTASVMDIKFISAAGSGTITGAINSIEFAVQVKQIFAGTSAANVRVINASWGWNGSPSQALLEEIERAAAHDILFVAGAGNGGADYVGDDNGTAPFYPASYNTPSVISVTATDHKDALGSFSNYGTTSVHLGAPGVLVLSTVMGGGYDWWSGTSMAAPHVSGAAALVLSRCALVTANLKNTLLFSVDYVPSLGTAVATGGRLNVNRAIRSCAAPSPSPSPTPSPTPTPTPPNSAPSVSLSGPAGGTVFTAPADINVTAVASDADGTISRVDFYAGGQLIGTDASSPYGIPWGNVPAGTYSLTAVATDNAGAQTTSAPASVTVNQRPSANAGGPYSAQAGQSVQFNGGLSADSDGTITSYARNFGDGRTGSGATPTHAYASAGTYTVTLTVTDNLGASSSASTTAAISAPPATTPAAPSNLYAEAQRQGEVRLYWSDNSSNETGFDIERSTSSGAVTVMSVGANVSAYTDRTVQRKETYYYRVRARNSAGTSAYSNTAGVRTK